MKTIRVDLENGDFIELADPGELSNRKFRGLLTELETLNASSGTFAERTAAEAAWVRRQIAAWRVTNAETCVVMTDPTRDDLDGISRTTSKKLLEALVASIKATAPTFQ